MDLWGFCPDCCLWFSCQGWLDRTDVAVCCPGCSGEPQLVVNRETLRGSSARLPAAHDPPVRSGDDLTVPPAR